MALLRERLQAQRAASAAPAPAPAAEQPDESESDDHDGDDIPSDYEGKWGVCIQRGLRTPFIQVTQMITGPSRPQPKPKRPHRRSRATSLIPLPHPLRPRQLSAKRLSQQTPALKFQQTFLTQPRPPPLLPSRRTMLPRPNRPKRPSRPPRRHKKTYQRGRFQQGFSTTRAPERSTSHPRRFCRSHPPLALIACVGLYPRGGRVRGAHGENR
jgi:hypothetical protein